MRFPPGPQLANSGEIIGPGARKLLCVRLESHGEQCRKATANRGSVGGFPPGPQTKTVVSVNNALKCPELPG